jgi:hypothetical protein
MADTQDKKTDVLNLRLDAPLAAEIQRIAERRGMSASEIARDLIRYGVAVERQLEAQELRRSYDSPRIDRDPTFGYLNLDARWVWYTQEELADRANGDW